MSTYPLDELHLAALRLECRVKLEPARASAIRYGKETWPKEPQRLAREAISSPTSAASLVRDLLARAGVDVHEHSEPDWDGECDHEIVVRFDGKGLSWNDYNESFDITDVPRLISALASLAPGDREGAMLALNEVGR